MLGFNYYRDIYATVFRELYGCEILYQPTISAGFRPLQDEKFPLIIVQTIIGAPLVVPNGLGIGEDGDVDEPAITLIERIARTPPNNDTPIVVFPPEPVGQATVDRYLKAGATHVAVPETGEFVFKAVVDIADRILQ